MTRLAGLCCVLGLLAAAACARAADVTDGKITPLVQLRDSGYLLGDLLDERVEFDLPAGFTLDRDSLPPPGRVAPWLELRRARVVPASHPGAVAVVATYQIFAEVEEASRVPIPPYKLRIGNGSRSQLVAVPEKSFLLSPALPPSLTDRDRELKPSPAPLPLPLRGTIAEFFAALLLAAACAAWLLWAYDRLPFLPRSPGPFARSWRRWRRRGRRALSADDGRALLRDWHGALAQAAGGTVYASTLPAVFARAPYLEPLRPRVERVFGLSWRSFYAASPAGDADAREVLELLRDSARRERGAPC